MRQLLTTLCLSSLMGLFLAAPTAVQAQTSPDPVGLATVAVGHGKARLTVTAGPSGAPSGFTVRWMTWSQFQSCGEVWPESPIAGEGSATFDGVATLNTWGAAERTFRLGAEQSLDIEIGDLFDESGVTGTVASELSGGQGYVFCAFANGASGMSHSQLSVTLEGTTTMQGQNCTYSWGYWKNHPDIWPVSGLTLGTVTYTAAQLLQILNQNAGGNGLISLAHQLIAAKLSIASGGDGSAVASTIAAADALIDGLVIPPIGSGSLPPGQTGTLTQTLDDYAQGVIGPGHCPSVRTRQATWGLIKDLYH